MFEGMKLLFVCLGNICRSPLAEAVCKHLAGKRPEFDGWVFDSAGTSRYHQGEPADNRMAEIAAASGIKIHHRSRTLTRADLIEFDYIFAMDKQNYLDILSLSKDPMVHSKVYLFRDFDPEGKGDVPDPYYGGREGFQKVLDIAFRTCREILYRI